MRQLCGLLRSAVIEMHPPGWQPDPRSQHYMHGVDSANIPEHLQHTL